MEITGRTSSFVVSNEKLLLFNFFGHKLPFLYPSPPKKNFQKILYGRRILYQTFRALSQNLLVTKYLWEMQGQKQLNFFSLFFLFS